MQIIPRLHALSDQAYQAFTARLLPTVDPQKILGVRMPVLRKLASELTLDKIGELPHQYHEENCLHALLINKVKDFEACVLHIERFFPYVDNWAVCDSLRPSCVRENKKKFLPYLKRWLQSAHPYTVRFAIEMLMVHYLDEDFLPEFAEMVSLVYSDNYYVNMMVAWYFATALSVRYDSVIAYLEDRRLSLWIHKKTIQKAVESLRISADKKELLRLLR